MKALFLCFVILLTGCSTTVPVKRTFPEIPLILEKKCGDLELIQGDKISITDMLKTVVNNYRMYYECSNKVDGWTDWYKSQKEIFDKVK